MIAANNVTLRIGKKALFEDVNIKFTEGNCYGLIGANGAGKSTFLKILSGQLETTNGDISITPGQRLSVLEQDHFKYDEYTVLDTVIMGNQRLYDIMKEKEAIYVDSVGETVTALLPIIDNFERAVSTFSEEDKQTDFFKGIEMIYNQMLDTFSKLGVEPIKALGEEFNPELHNAVMHIEDESIADNTVVEEFQKGYMYREKVIRYSMVKVAN